MNASSNMPDPESPWTIDADINDYLATMELPPEAVLRQYRAEREAIEAAAPRVGSPAPPFTLELLTADGSCSGERLSLSSFHGRHLALLFGNYTCPVYRGQIDRFQALYEASSEHVAFLMAYVKEAHPEDGWQLEINHRQSCVYRQPQSVGERAAVATDFVRRFGVTMPLVIDDIENTVCDRYAGSPERLYLIDPEGMVTHRSPPGPFPMAAVDAWCAAVRDVCVQATT